MFSILFVPAHHLAFCSFAGCICENEHSNEKNSSFILVQLHIFILKNSAPLSVKHGIDYGVKKSRETSQISPWQPENNQHSAHSNNWVMKDAGCTELVKRIAVSNCWQVGVLWLLFWDVCVLSVWTQSEAVGMAWLQCLGIMSGKKLLKPIWKNPCTRIRSSYVLASNSRT